MRVKIESEKLIERKLSLAVKNIGGWSVKIPGGFVIGMPDRLILLPGGKALFIELKTTKQKPRRSQTMILNKLRKLGFRAEVIDSSEGINNLIESL